MGVVLVHDRPGFHKILACVFVMGCSVLLLAIIIGSSVCVRAWLTIIIGLFYVAKTQLGVWLFEDLHGVSCSVGKLTHQALLYLSAYPLLHAIVS